VSERLTETVLRRIARPGSAETMDGQRMQVLLLIDEVRRLRGVILAEHGAIVASRVAPITTAFHAEAKAIREETS
jgi:hypothetical protein